MSFNIFEGFNGNPYTAAKRCFQDMEKQGLCQKASSPWASPLHIVVKKDGTIRPCGDYRRLNNITKADHYPLPNIADVMSFLHGATVFSKLDLMKGYFQVPMHPEDIPKTAIVTPFGTYTFNYSCFGLINAGATFQRLMDGILGDLPFCVCYVDDVLVFSHTRKQHLKAILERLGENGSSSEKTSASSESPKLSSWATPSHASGSHLSKRKSRQFGNSRSPRRSRASKNSWDW